MLACEELVECVPVTPDGTFTNISSNVCCFCPLVAEELRCRYLVSKPQFDWAMGYLTCGSIGAVLSLETTNSPRMLYHARHV